MNNGDLIEELSRYARHLPVKVVLSEIYGAQDLAGDFNDEYRIELCREDAIEAEAVVHMGSFLLIESQ